jgi:hypothetical protein
MQRDSRKRPPMKKRHPKNIKRLTQKTSDEKRGTPKTQRGSLKRPLKKNHLENAKGLTQKTSDEKEAL